jgi:hypothetical protein
MILSTQDVVLKNPTISPEELTPRTWVSVAPGISMVLYVKAWVKANWLAASSRINKRSIATLLPRLVGGIRRNVALS